MISMPLIMFIGSFLGHVSQIRNSIQPDTGLTLQYASVMVPFGRTVLNITLQRIENCTSGENKGGALNHLPPIAA